MSLKYPSTDLCSAVIRASPSRAYTDLNLGLVFLNSYKASLKKQGIDFDPALVFKANTNDKGGYQVGDQLLKMTERPTALLLVHELMAQGLYRRLNEDGLTAGKDLSVIGYRNSAQARMFTQSLTSFKLSLQDLGVALAEKLLASMSAQTVTDEVHDEVQCGQIWQMELVEGASDALRL